MAYYKKKITIIIQPTLEQVGSSYLHVVDTLCGSSSINYSTILEGYRYSDQSNLYYTVLVVLAVVTLLLLHTHSHVVSYLQSIQTV